MARPLARTVRTLDTSTPEPPDPAGRVNPSDNDRHADPLPYVDPETLDAVRPILSRWVANRAGPPGRFEAPQGCSDAVRGRNDRAISVVFPSARTVGRGGDPTKTIMRVTISPEARWWACYLAAKIKPHDPRKGLGDAVERAIRRLAQDLLRNLTDEERAALPPLPGNRNANRNANRHGYRNALRYRNTGRVTK